MEAYRKKLITRIVWQLIIIVVASGFVIFNFITVAQLEEQEHIAIQIKGFQVGMFSAWIVMFLTGIIKKAIAVRNEAVLKKMYIKEHDERTRSIQKEVASATVWISVLSLIFAIVIAGFYSSAVFYTLVGALIYLSTVACGAKIYFQRRM